ncbi:unnamed protein product [Cuscuta epithymum]|uniref:Uncharacterized protein n=1 Tax=Cuscuta epithymum TaxID=186058 RepID=A0AAV0EVD9_9ASTE|nr:unnamed protein product [Cuscuta epithymum]
METVAESSSCWKKHAFPLPLGVDVLSIWNTSITVTPAGEIVLLTLKRTPSLWVLLDKFGAYPVWKEFRIAGLADLPPNRVCESIETVEVQNIAENLFHLE